MSIVTAVKAGGCYNSSEKGNSRGRNSFGNNRMKCSLGMNEHNYLRFIQFIKFQRQEGVFKDQINNGVLQL